MIEDTTSSREERQAFLDYMVEQRGYVNDIHRMLVNQDLDVMRASNEVTTAVYLKQRSLDQKTKELLFVLSMTCLRVPRYVIQGHIRKALAHGATPREILEALELAIPEAGLPTFEHGLMAWAEVVGAKALNTDTDVYCDGRGSADIQ